MCSQRHIVKSENGRETAPRRFEATNLMFIVHSPWLNMSLAGRHFYVWNSVASVFDMHMLCDMVYGHAMTMSGALWLCWLCFILAVFIKVNIPICDIFDIWYDYYDVHNNIYTVP